MREIDPKDPVVQKVAEALEGWRVSRGAEPRPAACVGAPACLEPPRRDDGRVKCATCGHGFGPSSRTVFRVPELTLLVGGQRRHVIALVADASPITGTRALLRSQPVPAGKVWRYHADVSSFTPADGQPLPLGIADPFGPLRVRLPDGSELDEIAWRRAPWPSVQPAPLPAGAWFEREAELAQPIGAWLALAAVHLDVEGAP